MASYSFSDMVRELRLYVPELPIFLARKLVNDRYRYLMNMRGWSGLRGQGTFIVPAPYSTGTVALTQNSTTVTGTGTVFATSHVGQQIKINGQSPIFTITARASDTSITIDQPWPLADATAQVFSISQVYLTAPSDFKRFLVIYDPLRQWRLHFNVTQQELATWDPARTNVGDPYVLGDLRFSDGVPQYELWPAPSSQRGFPYLYIKQAADLVEDADRPIYPLQGHELVLGALADACMWPGTIASPNPLFGAKGQQREWEGRFLDAVNNIEREDESIYMTWLQSGDWMNAPYAPMDSKFIQNHAIVVR